MANQFETDNNYSSGFAMALEEASVKHFCKLFDVLMSDPKSDEAYKRFEVGLENLVNVSNRVEELIRTKYGRLMS